MFFFFLALNCFCMFLVDEFIFTHVKVRVISDLLESGSLLAVLA